MTESRPVFYFLDVDAFLPTTQWTPEIQRRYAERARVAVHGINRPGVLSGVGLNLTYHATPQGEENLIRNGMLQECLLQTEPFQSTQGNMIHDLHNKGLYRQRFCPDRAKLLFLLANTLLSYANTLNVKLQRLLQTCDEGIYALKKLNNVVQELELLYEQKGYQKNRAIQREYQGALKLVETLGSEIWAQARRINPHDRHSAVSSLHWVGVEGSLSLIRPARRH